VIRRVLFINPPWYRLQGLVSTYPPMGCLYIAGVLEENGYECVVWNADYSEEADGVTEGSSTINMDAMSKKHDHYLHALKTPSHPLWREVRDVIAEHQPDAVCIAVHTASYVSAGITARIAKELSPQTLVVTGGPHTTVAPEDLIQDPNVDIVITGEGERATLEMFNALNAARKPEVSGIFYKDTDGVHHTGARDYFEMLDDLPAPAKHLLLGKERMPTPVFQPIFTSRGCPFHCIYCSSHKTHGRTPRYQSVDKTIAEIKSLKSQFSVHHFFICDDTFGIDKKSASDLLHRLIEEKLGITWGCQSRGEVMTEEFTTLMKRAGCTQVSLGAETGSERIRKLIKKGNTVDDIRNATRNLRKNNIEVASFFMFGFPTETLEDVEQTLQLLEEIQPYTAHCNIATPDPGTELLTMMRAQGRIPEGADRSTFFHQNEDLFLLEDLGEEKSRELIRDLRRRFDVYNKHKQRRDLLRRFPLYMRIIYRERLYRNPRYLWNKLKDLL
jgi:anaerobic magnesium-protoporphyrin IX monomethyl ester cyclase